MVIFKSGNNERREALTILYEWDSGELWETFLLVESARILEDPGRYVEIHKKGEKLALFVDRVA